MCMLTHIPARVEIDPTGILNGASWNDDGHGWAIVGKNRILMGKGFDGPSVVEDFMRARHEHKGPALFHSRWATHGSVTLDNIHPFRVGRDRKTVLAHNGILPDPSQPIKGDSRSDTRIFATHLLPNLWADIDRPEVMADMGLFIRSNKLVILTANRQYAQRAYIVNEKLGAWDGSNKSVVGNGSIWYSNSDWTRALPKYVGKTGGGISAGGTSVGGILAESDEYGWAAWSGERPSRAGTGTPYGYGNNWDCEMCGAYITTTDEACSACLSCVYCWEAPEACDCHEPANLSVKAIVRAEGTRSILGSVTGKGKYGSEYQV